MNLAFAIIKYALNPNNLINNIHQTIRLDLWSKHTINPQFSHILSLSREALSEKNHS